MLEPVSGEPGESSSAAHGGEAEGTEAEESLPQDPKRNKGGHEESQEEKAEATEVKKKEGKRGRIHLNFDFPVFFFHRGLPISYKVLECHLFMGPVEAFTKHWLGW